MGPRKSGGDVFQEDIYPNCAAAKPALSADEWSSGNNKDPITMNMDPDERKDDDMDDGVTFTKRKTYDEVVAENMELKKMVKQLQDEISALKGTKTEDVVEEDNDGDAKEQVEEENMDVDVDN